MNQQNLDERVLVVVKPDNRYGEAKPGDKFFTTRRELNQHPWCLELAKDEQPAPTPRTATVAVRADVAKMMGLPMGRRQEGPLVYEVTRLRPDGKEPLPTRQELEARADARSTMQVRVMDAPEVQQFARAAKEEMEGLRDELERRHGKIEALQAARESLRAELARESSYLKQQEEASERLRADLAAAQKRIEEQAEANTAAVALCASKDEEIAKLRAELDAAKPAPKGKAKD
jgi:hypothetical protein